MLGDVHRLKQVLRNLVGNAVKYTPDNGAITLAAATEGPYVRVDIQDTGIGISDADLPYVFEKFYRAQMEAVSDIEGNGLGLAIVKSVVEQHGGHVSVESEVGKGACFTFTLPLMIRTLEP